MNILFIIGAILVCTHMLFYWIGILMGRREGYSAANKNGRT